MVIILQSLDIEKRRPCRQRLGAPQKSLHSVAPHNQHGPHGPILLGRDMADHPKIENSGNTVINIIMWILTTGLKIQRDLFHLISTNSDQAK